MDETRNPVSSSDSATTTLPPLGNSAKIHPVSPTERKKDANTDAANDKPKKEVRKKEFWMVMSVDLVDVVDVAEITEISYYLKVFWSDEHFLSKLTANTENGPKEIILVDSFTEENLVFDETSSAMKFDSDRRKSVRSSVGLTNSFWSKNGERDILDYCKGVSIRDKNSESFPFNVNKPFHNELSGEEIEKPTLRYYKEEGVVFVQLHRKSILKTPLEIHNYPFDVHCLPLQVATRQWKHDQVPYRWILAKELPEYLETALKKKDDHHLRLYDEDVKVIADLMKNETVGNNLKRLPSVWTYDEEGNPYLFLRVERLPQHYFWNMVVPIFFTLLVAMSTILTTFETEFGDNAGISVTALLTIAALKFVGVEYIPKKSYLTMAEKHLTAGMGITALITLENLTRSRHDTLPETDIQVVRWIIGSLAVGFTVLSMVYIVYSTYWVKSRASDSEWEQMYIKSIEDSNTKPAHKNIKQVELKFKKKEKKEKKEK